MKKRSELKAMILTGDGINCEVETALAFSEKGIRTEIIHIGDLLVRPERLEEAHILAFPGGFSFGDELGSGQILALKIKYSLMDVLKKFIAEKKLIIGICNGFQALVRLGLLPQPFEERTMTLTHNRQGHFINRWVELQIMKTHCVWTSEIVAEKIMLPIRHAEGKIVFKGDEKEQRHHYHLLKEEGQIVFRYAEDVDGSYEQIAGVCDPSGLILGLMPHPEAAVSLWQSPGGKDKREGEGIGSFIFESAIRYCVMNFK